MTHQQPRVRRGGHIGGFENIFDGTGYAVKRSEVAAPCDLAFGRACAGQCAVRVEV